ncbi:putative KU80 protein [Leptomonas seymouri]|uniref:Putative KU80 protein n=1 Tax=Leptomonas seymouri TaxID=5684 RepID=A0A0N1HUA9_LEPSE|nr:putative KU80 protein [Leptomonas seymouri]|eukprot:KPI83745.1 putative KU80 protein [Leptomonas seymouri]
MMKAATVLVLDTSLTDDAAFDNACEICEKLILDKIVYSPSDEVAVVLAGTETSRSSLYEKSSHARYKHITVDRELTRASRQTLESIAAVRQARQRAVPVMPAPSSAYDFIEALTVATDVLQAKTSGRKYTRAIHCITDARHDVVHKSDLKLLFDSLASDQVTLVVIGVDFHSANTAESKKEANGSSGNEEAEEEDEASWDVLGVKAQNEKILAGLCAALGAPSKVISPAEAADTLSRPHCRRVRQQPLLRVILSIGDIQIATQLFTLAQQERLPTLSRSTHDGADVVQTVVYETVSNANGQGERRQVCSEDLVECFLLGIDRIPCSAADREKMKVKGGRALQAIAFVTESEVEPYLLMGGTRTLLPLAGDLQGQRGYNVLVEAMEATGKVMLVRLVRMADVAPTLCACFVQRCDVGGDVPRCLVMAPLPFAEDIRGFQFSEYPEFCFTAAEEQQMDDLIDGLSVDGTVLAPQDTFNPMLQQFYATLAAKLRATSPPTAASPPFKTVPLLAQLQGTSTNFFVEGSVVYERMQKHRHILKACAAHFPYEEDAEDNGDVKIVFGASAGVRAGREAEEGERRRRLHGDGESWYHSRELYTAEGGLQTLPMQRRGVSSVSSRSPSTAAAPILLTSCESNDGPASSASSSTARSGRATTAFTVPHKVPEGNTAAAPPSTSTADPLKNLNSVLSQPNVNAT